MSMVDIVINKHSELFVQIIAERAILYEIKDYFSFYTENYKHLPSYKNGLWDGKIYLFNIRTNLLPFGLVIKLIQFCDKNEYSYKIDNNIKQYTFKSELNEFIESDISKLTNKELTGKYSFQLDIFKKAISLNKTIILSSTGCMDENTQIDVVFSEFEVNNLEELRKRLKKKYIKKGIRYEPNDSITYVDYMCIVTVSLLELEELIKEGNYPLIDTPSGLCKITNTYRKYGPGVLIEFDDGSKLKCSNNHLIKIKDEWTPASELRTEQLINRKKIISIDLVKEQEWVDFSVDADHESYYHLGMIHHNSGKSHIIYLIVRFLLKYTEGDILITVPTINLTTQMKHDFESYVNDDWNPHDYIDASHGYSSSLSKKRVLITTWQAIHKLDKSWFSRFQTYICDEVHLADSKSLLNIIDSLENVKYRYGFTGTLKGTKSNELVLIGYFGPIIKLSSTKQLMEEKVLSELDIDVHVLNYPDLVKKEFHKECVDYFSEIKWLVNNRSRNEYILNTAFEQKTNTLILFALVDTHANKLYTQAIEKNKVLKNKKIYLITKDVIAEKREEIRQLAEIHNDLLIFATFGTMSTGTNIRNLHTVIFAHPQKGKVRTFQSIGRILRLHETKKKAKLIDIADNLSKGKKRNITLEHLVKRLSMYTDEGHQYNIITQQV